MIMRAVKMTQWVKVILPYGLMAKPDNLHLTLEFHVMKWKE